MGGRLLGLLDPRLCSSEHRRDVVATIRALNLRAPEKRSLYAAWLLRAEISFTMSALDDVAVVDRPHDAPVAEA